MLELLEEGATDVDKVGEEVTPEEVPRGGEAATAAKERGEPSPSIALPSATPKTIAGRGGGGGGELVEGEEEEEEGQAA